MIIIKSIIQTKKECYVCKNPFVEDHHIFFGNPRRKLSEKFGLKVWLCTEHHRGTTGVHGRDGHELDLKLKRVAQAKFERKHTREQFIELMGKNYL